MMGVCERIRRKINSPSLTKIELGKDNEDHVFIEVNTGSPLTRPKFIYTDSEGKVAVKTDGTLDSEFTGPVRFFITAQKISKRYDHKFVFRVEDAEEGKPTDAINFNYEDDYVKPRYSGGV